MNIKAVVSKVENHIYWKKIEWGFYDKMDDESFLKMAYKRKFGKELDLKNPVTFNEKLQNAFVLKCTHDSGGLVICKDKSKLDREKARKKINKSLHSNYFGGGANGHIKM